MEESIKLQPAASAVGSLNSKVSAIGREPSGDEPRIFSQPLRVPWPELEVHGTHRPE